jgi:hypothetical protein
MNEVPAGIFSFEISFVTIISRKNLEEHILLHVLLLGAFFLAFNSQKNMVCLGSFGNIRQNMVPA